MDFLRTIFPFLYALVPILLGLYLMYWTLSRWLPGLKSTLKKVFLGVGGVALAIFFVAVIRMATVNEIPENELDNSVKKDRQKEMIERSKKSVEDSDK